MPEPTANRAYLSLGSNIDPERNLPAAARELAQYGKIVAVSGVWESRPVGFADQANFLNAAVLLATPLSPHDLKSKAIAEIEARFGRIRDPENVNAPRTIDIDVALFNRDILTIGQRTIPDPDILTRAFVAVPLAELDGDYVHPQDGRTLGTIAAGIKQDQPTLLIRPDVQLR